MGTTEKERREYVEAFHRSGLRPVAFCEKNGIHPKTFYAWRKRYSSKAVLQPASLGESTFLPLQITDEEKPLDTIAKQPIPLSFKTKNFCLEVDLDVQHNGAELKLIVQTLHELL